MHVDIDLWLCAEYEHRERTGHKRETHFTRYDCDSCLHLRRLQERATAEYHDSLPKEEPPAEMIA